MEQKKEIKFVDSNLQTNHEYSLEELIEECKAKFIQLKKDFKISCEKDGFELTRYTLESSTEGDYYGGDYAKFAMIIYRTETDKEFAARISHNKKEAERRELQRKAAEAKELTKRLEEEKLMKDPDYLKLLELKKKFKGKE